MQDKKGNTLTARRLILATGLPKAKLPDTEGAELLDSYDAVDIDPAKFRVSKIQAALV